MERDARPAVSNSDLNGKGLGVSNPSASDDTRYVELEIKLEHQQRLCEQLNEVVVDHTRQIMQLERVIGQLRKQVGDLREVRKQEPIDPIEERPPHY